MKIRELLMMETGEDMMGKPSGDMGPSMAPMAGNTMAGSMGGAAGTGMAATSPTSTGVSPAPMAGTPSPGTPSPGTPSPGTPSPGMPGGASAPMGGLGKQAGLGDWLHDTFMTGPKPIGGAAPADPLHGGNSAAGNAAANAVTGGLTGTLSKALTPNQQPPKPNQ